MAKQSKNDQTIRSMLLKQGTVHQSMQAPRAKDLKASTQAAIQARKAEFKYAAH